VLLESIAGLYEPQRGQIFLDGREITRLEPEKRDISIVYQDQVLFPHLNVKDNIAFGLKLRKQSAADIKTSLEWLADLLGISHLFHRKPDTLSGGEKQKVALARALSINPRLLLLDEPLSALDPENREYIQRELRRIHDQLRVTTVHVTHDFEEAIALGDRIAVIGDGRIQQIGTPEQIFRQPNSEFVARFAMARNIFRGEIIEDSDAGDVVLDTGDVKIAVVTELRGRCHASLRPEDILVSHAPFPSSARNSFAGAVTRVIDKGSVLYLTVSLPLEFTCLVTHNSFDAMGLGEGQEVYITFKASAIHVF
jgi:molybdopterin-binding protein